MTILLLANSALAWNHTQWLWERDEMPLKWYVSDYVEDSLPGDHQFEMLQQSYDNWSIEAPCAQLSNDYQGVRENHHAQGPSSGDQLNTIYFDEREKKRREK
jgi:hypothetical protein